MKVKWTIFFALCLIITVESFKADGTVPREDKNDKRAPYPAAPTRTLKRIVIKTKDESKSSESKEEYNDSKNYHSKETKASEEYRHVEHPIPPSGPMSRIVITKRSSFAYPATVDFKKKSKDSKETDMTDDLKGAAGEKLESLDKVPNDKAGENRDSRYSTTESVEAQHSLKFGNSSDDEDEDEVLDERSAVSRELPLYRLKPTATPITKNKEDLKEGVVNAFHHTVFGDRKEYFKRAISRMTKDELADLNHVLLAALKPKPDDDVKVDEVKEEFKEVVHEFVEQQKGTDDKKEALIEIEHVLEEQKPEGTGNERQVIKMKDWKKETVVGRIVKEEGNEGQIPPPIPGKDTTNLSNTSASAEPSTELNVKEGFVDKFVTKEEDSKETAASIPKEDVVGMIQTNQANFMPIKPMVLTNNRTKSNVRGLKRINIENIPAPTEKNDTVIANKPPQRKPLTRLRVLGRIMSETSDSVITSKSDDKEVIADSITQPDDNLEEIVKVVDVNGSVTKTKVADKDTSSPPKSTEKVTQSINCGSNPIPPQSRADKDKVISGLLGRTGRGRGNGWGARDSFKNLRRYKRHSRIYYTRTPYVTHHRTNNNARPRR